MKDSSIDVVVIGAGVVGCATARLLSQCGKSVMILEAGSRIAEGVTSRNSGVVHAGIYYPPGSLKATTCIRGNTLLFEQCQKKGVPHAKPGKLIVATNEAEGAALEELLSNAKASGATGLTLLSSQEVKNLEPTLPAYSAILSSETGIVDAYEFTRSLLQDAEEADALLVMNSRVSGIELRSGGGFSVETSRGQVSCQMLVNAAGLFSDEVAAMAGVNSYKIYPCRGDYFTFRPNQRYRHLIYPVKTKGSAGLGVHLTIDLSGRCKLGPDTEYVTSKENFTSAEHKLDNFRLAAEKLFGKTDSAQLSYDTCGIRPKLRGPTEASEKDFVVALDQPGLVNMVGIESPGLTASMALAEIARDLLIK